MPISVVAGITSTMTRSPSTSSSNSLTTKTKQLLTIHSKFCKALTGSHSLKVLKELINMQNAEEETVDKVERPKPYTENRTLQSQTKGINVVTRNDILYNTYGLDFENQKPKSKTIRNHSSPSSPQLKVYTNLKRSKTTGTNINTGSKSSPKLRTSINKRNSQRVEPALPKPAETPSDLSLDNIDDIGANEPFVPADDQIKTEMVMLKNTFTENGALLSIPVHRTISRESDFSDYR